MGRGLDPGLDFALGLSGFDSPALHTIFRLGGQTLAGHRRDTRRPGKPRKEYAMRYAVA